ncbi:hypothetical protein LguiA_016007 [Lonicera macranthoides]
MKSITYRSLLLRLQKYKKSILYTDLQLGVQAKTPPNSRKYIYNYIKIAEKIFSFVNMVIAQQNKLQKRFTNKYTKDIKEEQ